MLPSYAEILESFGPLRTQIAARPISLLDLPLTIQPFAKINPAFFMERRHIAVPLSLSKLFQKSKLLHSFILQYIPNDAEGLKTMGTIRTQIAAPFALSNPSLIVQPFAKLESILFM